MKFRLRFSTQYKDGLGQWNKETAPFFWFQNAGLSWPGNPGRHLIDRTTPVASEGRLFDTKDEALDMMARCSMNTQWEVMEVES